MPITRDLYLRENRQGNKYKTDRKHEIKLRKYEINKET